MAPYISQDRLLNAQDLNEDQKRAVAAALSKSRPIVSIQGPPGTGKTQVVTEIIIQVRKSCPSKVGTFELFARRKYFSFTKINMPTSIFSNGDLGSSK